MNKELQELTESIELILITAKLMGYQTEITSTGAWRILRNEKQYFMFHLMLGTLLVVTDEDYNQHFAHKETHKKKLQYLQKILEGL